MEIYVIKDKNKNLFSNGATKPIMRKIGKPWFNILDLLEHINLVSVTSNKYKNNLNVIRSNFISEKTTKIPINVFVEFGKFCKMLKEQHYSYFNSYMELEDNDKLKYNYYLIFKNTNSLPDLYKEIKSLTSLYLNGADFKQIGNKIFLSDKDIALTLKLSFNGTCLFYDIDTFKEIFK